MPPDTNKWPKGVRRIGLEELDYLGLDSQNRLFWDGKLVAMGFTLSFWQTIAAAVATAAAAMSFLNGTYDLLHKLGVF